MADVTLMILFSLMHLFAFPSPSSMWMRKWFHFFAFLVFLPGIALDPDFTSLVASVTAFLFLVAEVSRLCLLHQMCGSAWSGTRWNTPTRFWDWLWKEISKFHQSSGVCKGLSVPCVADFVFYTRFSKLKLKCLSRHIHVYGYEDKPIEFVY